MKTEVKKEKMVNIPASDLLSLVAYKLKDRILFPEKLESAQAYLKQVKNSAI